MTKKIDVEFRLEASRRSHWGGGADNFRTVVTMNRAGKFAYRHTEGGDVDSSLDHVSDAIDPFNLRNAQVQRDLTAAEIRGIIGLLNTISEIPPGEIGSVSSSGLSGCLTVCKDGETMTWEHSQDWGEHQEIFAAFSALLDRIRKAS